MAEPTAQRGPTLQIDLFDSGLEGHESQLPVSASMLRWIAGPDRPDYALLRFDAPFEWTPGPAVDRDRIGALLPGASPGSVQVHYGVIAGRIVGERPHNGMRQFPVGLAFVLDEAVLTAEALRFEAIEYVAVALVSDTSTDQ